MKRDAFACGEDDPGPMVPGRVWLAIALTVGVVWTLATHVGWTLCALIPAGGDLAAYHADPASVWARVGLGFCPEAGTGELASGEHVAAATLITQAILCLLLACCTRLHIVSARPAPPPLPAERAIAIVPNARRTDHGTPRAQDRYSEGVLQPILSSRKPEPRSASAPARAKSPYAGGSFGDSRTLDERLLAGRWAPPSSERSSVTAALDRHASTLGEDDADEDADAEDTVRAVAEALQSASAGIEPTLRTTAGESTDDCSMSALPPTPTLPRDVSKARTQATSANMASARGQRGSVMNNEDPLGRQPGRTKQWMRAAKREIKSMAGECLCLGIHPLSTANPPPPSPSPPPLQGVRGGRSRASGCKRRCSGTRRRSRCS